MAVSNYFQLQAFPQGEDLSKAHGIFVKLNSSGAIVKTQAATDAVVGVVIISLPYDSTDSKNCPGVCDFRGRYGRSCGEWPHCQGHQWDAYWRCHGSGGCCRGCHHHSVHRVFHEGSRVTEPKQERRARDAP